MVWPNPGPAPAESAAQIEWDRLVTDAELNGLDWTLPRPRRRHYRDLAP